MSLDVIHLRKLLKLFYLTPSRQTSELRADIRQDIARDAGIAGGGGDFHVPFWRDARDHVFHRTDLHSATDARIQSNAGRERLYSMLRDGFLEWWNERRRWTNEPFRPIDAPHSRLQVEGMGIIKVENVLAVQDAAGGDHYIYPYFAEAPPINSEAARVALWVLQEAFPQHDGSAMRLLDVLRGQTFSTDRNPLQGDEEHVLRTRYQQLIDRRQELLMEY